MTRAEHIWNYPLYSIKRFPTFYRFCWALANKLSEKGEGGRLHLFVDMLWCNLRYGMMDSRDYAWFQFYRKSAHERNKFLTKRRYFQLIHRFDKNLFYQLIDKENMYQYCSEFIHREWLIVDSKSDIKVVQNFINEHDSLIAKPSSSEQGHGVFEINKNNREESLSLLIDSQSGWIIEEKLVNCEEIAKINPSSLNTLRVVTLIDKNEDVQILAMILRVGQPNSTVDNWGAGGIAYFFDTETGICCQKGYDKQNNLNIYHPGSNIKMVGFELPRFIELREYIVKLAKTYSKARYVGWDIALTPMGFELVEMNFPGGHDMMQASGVPFYDFIKNNW